MEPIANHHPQVCCWNCDHYQRYDPERRPKRCDGECRLNAIPSAIFTTDFMPDPNDQREFGHNKETAFSFPHITCGLRMRCRSFKKSTEEDLPQSPLSFNCQHTPPTRVMEWKPWIKPGKENCFTCAWFEPELCQRKHDAQLDNGGCLHDPPRPRQFHIFEQMFPRAETGATAMVTGALGLWCANWEGPRPEIGFTDEDPREPVKSPHDAYSQWEARRDRLVWLSSMQIAEVKKMQRQVQARAQEKEPRLISLENIERVK